MTDYEDYENNLAFKPIGDWADTEPKANTDRTQSSLDLVDKIAELTKWLDLRSEYIVKLEDENSKLKELLKEWLLFAEEEDPKDFTIISERIQELAQQTNELLGNKTENEEQE